MRAPAFWWRAPGFAAALLAPLAWPYAAVAAARLARRGETVGVPVICIGNPTLGGAGKTPAARAVARLLAKAGERPVFLTRGYGGTQRGPLRVDPDRHGAAEVGDEPLLLARDFPTVVASDRAAGARFAVGLGASVIVMDDGFQNPSLAKDVSILVVDGRRGIGNGLVFPAGPLRAPLAPQLARAAAVLRAGEGEAGAAVAVAAQKAGLAVFAARLEPDPAVVAKLAGRRALAFAGIGDPEKFFATLAAAGIDCVARMAFPDHHPYSPADAAEILAHAEAHGLVPVTTEKDHVRLAGAGALAGLAEATAVLPVTLVPDDAAGLAALALGGIAARR